MTVKIDEGVLRRRLGLLLEEPVCRVGLENLAADPFFVAFFLASVSQGEGLGEAAVGMIGQEELAGLIRDLDKQEAEERGHKERTIEAARGLFPEFFDGDDYRYENALEGQPYYVSVLETNRARLKEIGRYSRLNLYLTTTFAYEEMVVLLYAAVAEAVARSALPEQIRKRIVALIEGILAEEEDHLGIVDQHNALLAADRTRLSPEARSMLDALDKLELADY